MSATTEKLIEKKSVRTVTFALGAVCIILSVSLAGAVAEIIAKQNAIVSLNSGFMESARANGDIINLRVSMSLLIDQQVTISQPANSYTSWTKGILVHGYVSVNVLSSNTSSTYVRVIWSSYGIDYDDEIVVGTSGIASFPVLPTENLEIRVGNTDQLAGATETVTITYVY